MVVSKSVRTGDEYSSCLTCHLFSPSKFLCEVCARLGFRHLHVYRLQTLVCNRKKKKKRPPIELGIGDMGLVIIQRIASKMNSHVWRHIVAW